MKISGSRFQISKWEAGVCFSGGWGEWNWRCKELRGVHFCSLCRVLDIQTDGLYIVKQCIRRAGLPQAVEFNVTFLAGMADTLRLN